MVAFGLVLAVVAAAATAAAQTVHTAEAHADLLLPGTNILVFTGASAMFVSRERHLEVEDNP